jgi:protein-tyrosine-phosphatase
VSREFKVLVVCSGNTCRSPLAAAMLADGIAKQAALSNVRISSAGTSAWDGSSVSEGSYLVGLERGLDLSEHRARLLTRELVSQADLILTMTVAHLQRVFELGGRDKAATMVEYAGAGGVEDIPDPFGGDVSEYRAAAGIIEKLIDPIVARLKSEAAR